MRWSKGKSSDENAIRAHLYEEFAAYYDRLMAHVDYEGWFRYIFGRWQDYLTVQNMVEAPLTLLEIGCGTGKLLLPFVQKNYSIVGLDRSWPMLRELKDKNLSVPVVCGDMCRIPLEGGFDFIFAVHDTVNYLLSEKELLDFLHEVRRLLAPGGVFLFDITTEYNILQNFDQKEERHRFGKTRVFWSNNYDWLGRVISSYLRFEFGSGKKREIKEERHHQRIYSEKEIRRLLAESGWRIIWLDGDNNKAPPEGTSIMLNFWVVPEDRF